MAKCDIWSVGCLLFFITFGKPFATGNTNHELVKNIKKGFTIDNTSAWGPEMGKLLDLIKSMLDPNPQSRIEATEALNSPFLTSMDTLQNRTELKAENFKKMILNWYQLRLRDTVKDYISFLSSYTHLR